MNWKLYGVVLAGALLAGCNNYTGEGQQVRQEGDTDIHSPENQRVASPILGETTGSGHRVDQRTGGAVTPGTVAPADQQRIAPVRPDTINPPPPGPNTPVGPGPAPGGR